MAGLCKWLGGWVVKWLGAPDNRTHGPRAAICSSQSNHLTTQPPYYPILSDPDRFPPFGQPAPVRVGWVPGVLRALPKTPAEPVAPRRPHDPPPPRLAARASAGRGRVPPLHRAEVRRLLPAPGRRGPRPEQGLRLHFPDRLGGPVRVVRPAG